MRGGVRDALSTARITEVRIGFPQLPLPLFFLARTALHFFMFDNHKNVQSCLEPALPVTRISSHRLNGAVLWIKQCQNHLGRSPTVAILYRGRHHPKGSNGFLSHSFVLACDVSGLCYLRDHVIDRWSQLAFVDLLSTLSGDTRPADVCGLTCSHSGGTAERTCSTWAPERVNRGGITKTEHVRRLAKLVSACC